MTGRGGARNRSGPSVDPNSLRSDKRGLSFRRLPAEGFGGVPPEWPLPGLDDREWEVWETVWTYPQAAAWISEPWRWLTVAMWVRTFVVCESRDATAADKGSLHRFADQIGLTPAGMKENGWLIEESESVQDDSALESVAEAARNRLKVV